MAARHIKESANYYGVSGQEDEPASWLKQKDGRVSLLLWLLVIQISSIAQGPNSICKYRNLTIEPRDVIVKCRVIW